MTNILYLEIAVTSIVVLFILLYKVRSVLGHFQERYLFSFVLKLAVVSTGLECFTYIFDGVNFYMAQTVVQFLNAGYFVVTAILSFYWLCFIGRVLNIDILGLRKNFALLCLPAAIAIIMSVLSIWMGLVFDVDSQNMYVRGDFYIFYVVCNYFYIVFASYICLQRVFMKQYYLDREMNLSLTSFAVFPIVGAFVQVLWEDATTTAPSIVLALLLSFVTMLTNRITTDALTGLNNRKQLHRYLLNRMPNIPRGTMMVLFYIDVCNLKGINREYGYEEGDKAVVFVSNVLKQVCGPQGCFINRGHGDTFNLAAVMNNETEADALVSMFQEALAERAKKLFYDLTVTVAYATETMENNIPDLIIRAETNLKEKKKMRQN